MKARLFDRLLPKEKEMYFKVGEDEDNIWVALVDGAGKHIQYICFIGEGGVLLSNLHDKTDVPFKTVTYNGRRQIALIR